MSCTRHFLNFQWEHHRWRQRVTYAENPLQHETNMWGRVVDGAYTRCVKHDVCDECGKTREDINCLCDCDVGERCAIRREWIDSAPRTTP